MNKEKIELILQKLYLRLQTGQDIPFSSQELKILTPVLENYLSQKSIEIYIHHLITT